MPSEKARGSSHTGAQAAIPFLASRTFAASPRTPLFSSPGIAFASPALLHPHPPRPPSPHRRYLSHLPLFLPPSPPRLLYWKREQAAQYLERSGGVERGENGLSVVKSPRRIPMQGRQAFTTMQVRESTSAARCEPQNCPSCRLQSRGQTAQVARLRLLTYLLLVPRVQAARSIRLLSTCLSRWARYCQGEWAYELRIQV